MRSYAYKTKITLDRQSDVHLRASCYRGALIRVTVDGIDRGVLAFAPYEKEINDLPAGDHSIELKLFGTRVNTFSALHNCSKYAVWKGPPYWYSQGENWSYEYCLTETGILSSPVVEVYAK